MTEIIIGKDRDGAYREVTCMGHAGYAAYGRDIVCASVSVLVINTINALTELAGEDLETTVLHYRKDPCFFWMPWCSAWKISAGNTERSI